MNERYQRVLEYPKILNRLAGLAVSAMGKERALALRPSGDFEEVRRLQAQTEEASSVIAYTGGNPMSEFDDVREYLKLSTVGATLSMKALLSVAGALRACRTVRKALVTEREDTPILTEMGSRIASNRMLEEDITNAIISEDEMSDHASPELYDIRRHIRVINDRVRDKLNSYIRSASTQKYLMDSIITMRNGRYVIPVKAEYRQQVPGLVHDQSGSGSTLFIEPMAIVEAGNELKEWTLKERQEMEKILKDFSARIAPDAPMIASSLGILADLDCVFARAYLAREMNAVEPKLNADGRVNLIHARHPLIDPEKVVPSNLWMGEDFTTLVITGPNTGGKTVTLKTVGLLTLMAQSGMQIPAQFGSEIAVFDEVFADIGSATGLGWDVVPDLKERVLRFVVREGVDRTTGSRRAVLSRRLGNVDGASWTEDGTAEVGTVYAGGSGEDRAKSEVMAELKKRFKPEFLNRLDEVILFDRLGEPETEDIAARLLDGVAGRLRALGVGLDARREAVALLARESYDGDNGARPIRRAIRSRVEEPAAELLLTHALDSGDTLCLAVEEEKLVLRPEKAGQRRENGAKLL